MAEKLISSLLYGDHPAAPKPRELKRRARLAAIIAVIFALAAGIAWKFANYREETRVEEFLEQLQAGQYEDAFAGWESNGRYQLANFLEHWGRDGFYIKDANEVRVVDSHRQGGSVIVQIEIDKFEKPVALIVNTETLKLSFAPPTR
jgi:hypothetical protein